MSPGGSGREEGCCVFVQAAAHGGQPYSRDPFGHLQCLKETVDAHLHVLVPGSQRSWAAQPARLGGDLLAQGSR